jgi:hypothetical protein
MDEVQFRADIRRATPLALRLTRLGGLPTAPALIRALRRALNEREPSATVTAG